MVGACLSFFVMTNGKKNPYTSRFSPEQGFRNGGHFFASPAAKAASEHFLCHEQEL